MMNNKIKVSVCVITYNHEKFLKNCLEGIINQIVDFDYEILIGEDKSTDSTLLIAQEFEKTYKRVKLVERPKNLGMIGNWLDTIQRCTGEYIALCEGDDYWIDPYKLQKQVNFLEDNKDFVLCGSRAQIMDENGNRGESEGNIDGEIYLNQALRKNQFITCTIMFRSEFVKLPPFENYVDFFTGDWPLWCSLLSTGKGYNFDFITAQYNVHSGGATSGRSTTKMLKNKLNDRKLMMENFPQKKKIIKNYGSKIIFHFIWKSFIFKSDYYTALWRNRRLILNYLYY